MFEYKKRIFLVNRDLQFRFAKAAAVAGVASTILTAAVVLYPLYVFQILRIPKFLPLPIMASMLLAVILNIILIASFTLVLTHRLAGPVYGLLREFRRIAAGLFGHEMRFRKDDELKYLIRNFNEASNSLKGLTELDIITLESTIDAITNHGYSDTIKEDLVALLQRFKARINWTEVESDDD